jgi:hypothetical protein
MKLRSWSSCEDAILNAITSPQLLEFTTWCEELSPKPQELEVLKSKMKKITEQNSEVAFMSWSWMTKHASQ